MPEKLICEEEKIDVLSLLNSSPNWVDYRVSRFGSVLEHYEISHAGMCGRKYDDLVDALNRTEVGVFLNETWQISPGLMNQLAEEFPETKFVSLTHGSPVNIEYVGNWAKWHIDFLMMSREKDNCFYGHVMDQNRFPAPDGCKVISIPNVAMLPKRVRGRRRKKLGKKPAVLIAGRNQFIKNLSSQVSAAINLSRSLPNGVKVYIMSNCAESDMKHHLTMLSECEIEAYFVPFSKWSDYIKWISRTIDISFCCTLTESFGLIALECMMLGIPVMGSYAVEFLPEIWKANPQSPYEMALVAKSIIERPAMHSEQALDISKKVSEENEINLIKNITKLLE